ncbi:hypothetical protein [Streptomyces fagopyri]|uniref:hypothetical protein n=1 Tax=Streptomyces fagopyri TaxID=2662397 RepID=UPI0033C70B9D
MESESVNDAAAARHARFGKLPERVPFHEMIETASAEPSPAAAAAYDPESSWNHFSCLAFDLGL